MENKYTICYTVQSHFKIILKSFKGGHDMDETHKKGLNADLIESDLENCCRGEALCGQCRNTACNIGFAKRCISDYKKAPKKEVPGGTDNIPTTDFRTFDEVELETAIAHILKECKDCKEDHSENCIINIIRNCYEVSLLGDTHVYEGSALQYLMFLREHFPDQAACIADVYASLP